MVIYIDVYLLLGEFCTMTYVTDLSGVITSPNYPGDYPDNLNICWSITSTSLVRQVLKVEHFLLS